MGILDIFDKDKREQSKKQNRLEREFIVNFAIKKNVDEIIARAQSLATLGRHDEAKQEYARIVNYLKHQIKLNPKNIKLKVYLATFYGWILWPRDEVEAENYLRTIVKEHFNDENADLTFAYYMLGHLIYFNKKDGKEALKYLDLGLKAPRGNDIDEETKKEHLSLVYSEIASIKKNLTK
jgi:tetratricopeptide (TPR) repeat protein